MTIQNNTNSIYTTNVNSLQKTHKREETSFDSLIQNTQNPKEIPFQNYKSYSIDDINRIFPVTIDKSLNEKALELRDIANGTTDDNLNKILFKLAIKEEPTVAEDIVGGGGALRINGLKMIKVLSQEIANADSYMKNNNIAFTIENLSKIQGMLSEHIDMNEAKKNEMVTPQEYFDSLELTNKDMEEYQENHRNNPWLIHMDEVKTVINNIKYEYQKNRYEQNILLGKYT